MARRAAELAPIHLDRRRLSLVTGDVSDKGLPAALFMALPFSLLRAEMARSDDPLQILRNVNRAPLKMNASGMYVTLLYGVLDCETGRLRYARAGHLPPMVVDARGRRIEIERGEGQALGLFDEVTLAAQEVTPAPLARRAAPAGLVICRRRCADRQPDRHQPCCAAHPHMFLKQTSHLKALQNKSNKANQNKQGRRF